jgi:hypothetical protein
MKDGSVDARLFLIALEVCLEGGSGLPEPDMA